MVTQYPNWYYNLLNENKNSNILSKPNSYEFR